MSAVRVRALLAFIMMVLAFAGAQAWRPSAHLVDTRPRVNLEAVFPKQFGNWSPDNQMPVQLVSPDQAALLKKIYDQTLSRTYVNSAGERVILSVAYGGDQSDATRAHRPEVCYPAQGFQILSSRTVQFSATDRVVNARELVSKLGGRIEPIIYWVVVGDEVATSGTQQKLAQLRFGIRGIVPDGMLVRVSSIDPDPARANMVHARFIAELSRAMPDAVRSLVFGGLRGQASGVAMNQ